MLHRPNDCLELLVKHLFALRSIRRDHPDLAIFSDAEVFAAVGELHQGGLPVYFAEGEYVLPRIYLQERGLMPRPPREDAPGIMEGAAA